LIIDPDGCLDLIDNLSINWSPQKADLALQRFIKLVNRVMKRSKFAIKRHFRHYLFGKIFPKFYWSGPRYGYCFYGDVISRKMVLTELNKFVNTLIECKYKGQWIGSNFSFRSEIYSVKKFEKKDLAIKCGVFIDRLFRYKQKSTQKYWCDSTPFNILYANELLDMFPKAKIIHVYRDPRDVISSYITKSWGGNRVDDVIGMIFRIWEKWLKIRSNLSQEQLFEIKLESFVEDYENVVKELFNFLNLTELDDIKRLNILTNKSFGRYKKDLTRNEISKINLKFKEILEILNYI